MKKRTIFAIVLLILLTTITSQHEIINSKFNLKKITIDNNFLLKEKDIKEQLSPIYNKNLFNLKNSEIESILIKNSFIEGFDIKKKYPDRLKIRIFEKKPIAILFKEKNKYYLSDRIELIEFKKNKKFQDLPYIIGNQKSFKNLYDGLKKIGFPINSVKKFTLYDLNRWDLETNDKKIIKLPPKNFIKILENYLNLKKKDDFNKYKVFDYRIKNQLILK